MDDIDRQLLSFLLQGLPLERRPFAGIAAKIGIDTAEVLFRMHRLREEKIIGTFGAIFDAHRFGYRSTWVAMSIPPEELDLAAHEVGEHPGVGSISSRDHEWNLWFSLALPPQISLEDQVGRLCDLVKSSHTLVLPALKTFKAGRESEAGESRLRLEGRSKEIYALNEFEIRVIRRLQEDWPFTDEPYQVIARDLGLSEEDFFEILHKLIRQGCLLRFAAVPPSSGVASAHSLVVWQIPEERRDEIGRKLALLEEVAQCTERPAYDHFPYALYTMIFPEDEAGCRDAIRRMEEQAGPWQHLLLSKVKEYKKVKIRYFPKELEDGGAQEDPTPPTEIERLFQ